MPRRPCDTPLNKVRCATCPFNEDGVLSIRHAVEERCMTVGSQFCHHTHDQTLCRGARDHQLQIFHRMGLLEEATDECWDKTWSLLSAGKGANGKRS